MARLIKLPATKKTMPKEAMSIMLTTKAVNIPGFVVLFVGLVDFWNFGDGLKRRMLTGRPC
jgi:hypothetical protein